MVPDITPENQTRISCLEQKLKEKSEDILFPLYKRLKDWAIGQWKGPTVIYKQVGHGYSHSEKLHEFADILLEQKISEDFFTKYETEKEIFLILASIYLHDIGMQTEWERILNIKSEINQLSSEDMKKIRDNHAAITGQIIRSWKKELPVWLESRLTDQQKAVICDDLNEALAYICESHKKEDIALVLDSEIELMIGKTSLKIDFITALLKLCDALNMDKSRINTMTFEDSLKKFLRGEKLNIEYNDDDWRRYFQCYYVEDVKIELIAKNKDGAGGPNVDVFRITVFCRFNKYESKELIDALKVIYSNRLKKSEHDCVTVLNKYGIIFSNQNVVKILDASFLKLKVPESMEKLFVTKSTDKEAVPDKDKPDKGKLQKSQHDDRKDENGLAACRRGQFSASTMYDKIYI